MKKEAKLKKLEERKKELEPLIKEYKTVNSTIKSIVTKKFIMQLTEKEREMLDAVATHKDKYAAEVLREYIYKEYKKIN